MSGHAYNHQYWLRTRERQNLNARLRRKDPRNRANFIIRDSRKSDKKSGLLNDLDIDFVRAVIATGCAYCGSHDKMTLDRVDNTVGHVKSNVLSSCSVCNQIRGDFPFAAWQIIAPAVKQARITGLLSGWKPKSSKYFI